MNHGIFYCSADINDAADLKKQAFNCHAYALALEIDIVDMFKDYGVKNDETGIYFFTKDGLNDAIARIKKGDIKYLIVHETVKSDRFHALLPTLKDQLSEFNCELIILSSLTEDAQALYGLMETLDVIQKLTLK